MNKILFVVDPLTKNPAIIIILNVNLANLAAKSDYIIQYNS